jgi:hypothetical protein
MPLYEIWTYIYMYSEGYIEGVLGRQFDVIEKNSVTADFIE